MQPVDLKLVADLDVLMESVRQAVLYEAPSIIIGTLTARTLRLPADVVARMMQHALKAGDCTTYDRRRLHMTKVGHMVEQLRREAIGQQHQNCGIRLVVDNTF